MFGWCLVLSAVLASFLVPGHQRRRRLHGRRRGPCGRGSTNQAAAAKHRAQRGGGGGGAAGQPTWRRRWRRVRRWSAGRCSTWGRATPISRTSGKAPTAWFGECAGLQAGPCPVTLCPCLVAALDTAAALPAPRPRCSTTTRTPGSSLARTPGALGRGPGARRGLSVSGVLPDLTLVAVGGAPQTEARTPGLGLKRLLWMLLPRDGNGSAPCPLIYSIIAAFL